MNLDTVFRKVRLTNEESNTAQANNWFECFSVANISELVKLFDVEHISSKTELRCMSVVVGNILYMALIAFVQAVIRKEFNLVLELHRFLIEFCIALPIPCVQLLKCSPKNNSFY